jgi:hypothetical protein
MAPPAISGQLLIDRLCLEIGSAQCKQRSSHLLANITNGPEWESLAFLCRQEIKIVSNVKPEDGCGQEVAQGHEHDQGRGV